MEKIKQALDKARMQRQIGVANTVASRKGGELDALDFEYTQTRSIDVAPIILSENRLINDSEQNDYTNSIKVLRTQVLQRMNENNWTSLAITSPRHNEGKTLTAINLAISIAMEIKYTVLVVDANLRDPGIHKYFGFQPTQGLGEYLNGKIAMPDVLVHPRQIEHFVILPCARPVKNSSEMMASPKMRALVEEVKSRYPRRIVIFDLPPLLDAADALAFAPAIDSALLVLEDGVSKESEIKAAVDRLSVTNILGTVLNKAL